MPDRLYVFTILSHIVGIVNFTCSTNLSFIAFMESILDIFSKIQYDHLNAAGHCYVDIYYFKLYGFCHNCRSNYPDTAIGPDHCKQYH